MIFCKSFVGNGLSELGFTQTYSTLYSYWPRIFWKKTPIATKSKFSITKRLGGSLVLVPRLPSTSPLSPSSSWRNTIQLCDIVSTRYSAPCPQVSARCQKGTKRELFRFPNPIAIIRWLGNLTSGDIASEGIIVLQPGIFDGPQSPRGEHDTSGDFVKSFGQ